MVTAIPTAAPQAHDSERWSPEAMHCQDCGTTWYSRMAVVVTGSRLGRCVLCGGALAMGTVSDDEQR